MQRTETDGSGRRASLRGLLVLNVLLLAVLATVTFGKPADAQVRPRGEYLMVGGNVKGLTGSAVYIVDGTNQELIAVTYDSTAKDLAGLGYRNLAADAINVGGGALEVSSEVIMRSKQRIDGAAATLWASAFVIIALIITQAGRFGGNPAFAGQADSHGSYSMLTVNAGLGGGEQPYELLYVLDSRGETLMVYDMDDARKGVVLRTGGSLASVFQSARPR